MIFILLTTIIFTPTYVAQTAAPTAAPTASPNEFWDIMIGDTCYCDTGEELDPPSKASKDPSGYGPGRCTCKDSKDSIGITEMRIIYQLTNGNDVDITFLFNDNKTPICTTFMGVEEGTEITCDATIAMPGDEYDDTTFIKVYDTVTMTNCTSKITTPCKKNGHKDNMIIGDTGTPYCGIIVSGWKDPDNEGFCDDGVEPCECSFNPTNAPSITPSLAPSISPTQPPSNAPSISPTQPPSNAPSMAPSITPSIAPSNAPSIAPTQPPSITPSIAPSIAPTQPPSIAPSIAPSNAPSITPTQPPSIAPSIAPSLAPTQPPSIAPTQPPSIVPSIAPSISPTQPPTIDPTSNPTYDPTTDPTSNPTQSPTTDPTTDPTRSPTPYCRPIVQIHINERCTHNNIDIIGFETMYTPIQTYQSLHEVDINENFYSVPQHPCQDAILQHTCQEDATPVAAKTEIMSKMNQMIHHKTHGIDLLHNNNDNMFVNNIKKDNNGEHKLFSWEMIFGHKYGGYPIYCYYIIGGLGIYAVVITIIGLVMYNKNRTYNEKVDLKEISYYDSDDMTDYWTSDDKQNIL